ncbi:MAG: hypothetical protein COT15_02295 [Candidatus Diapherotrites archaeon CG08_land_8_20_14_0_20_34_12]|nr:MAG: hypothetical protein COT15_02295 [Candidatus Diapherotrites archaeon CG08_land_8_20_14_0_20_34_12]
MAGKKPIKIDMLVTGPGGELMFKTVEVTPDNVKELLETTTDPVIKHNLKKELKNKRISF